MGVWDYLNRRKIKRERCTQEEEEEWKEVCKCKTRRQEECKCTMRREECKCTTRRVQIYNEKSANLHLSLSSLSLFSLLLSLFSLSLSLLLSLPCLSVSCFCYSTRTSTMV